MTIKLVSDEKIAVTSSKGNQEKWREARRWYKVDQFGYEALAEAVASALLEWSNIEKETPFTFVRYQMERVSVHGRERTGCSSENFLRPEQSIVTLDHLLSRVLGKPLREVLARLSSDKKRIALDYGGIYRPARVSSIFDTAVRDRRAFSERRPAFEQHCSAGAGGTVQLLSHL